MATILNLQTTVNTPKVNYKIDAVTSNRTIDGITIKFTITSSLSSSGSSLGSGSTYGIVGYIKVLGTEYSFTIKGTSDKWSGTTAHTVSRTITFTGIEPTATSITGITFRTTRTGNKDDGKIEHAGELASTKCSDITFESAHTPPTDVYYTMEETNQKLLDYGFPHDVIVENLSNKKFTIGATLYDGATVQYAFAYNRINFHRVETTDNPATVYYDFGTNEIALDDEGLKVPIAVRITDSLGSGKFNNETNELAKAWDMYEYYPYNKITLIETGTTAKRNGQISGKVKLNVNGTFYNGFIGSINQTDGYKPTIKYKFWALGDEEPTTYDYEVSSDNIVIENNTFKVSDYEIGTTDETQTNFFNPEKAYRVKVYVEDNFTNTETNQEKPIPLGESTWTEFKDRCDFKKITIKGNEVTLNEYSANEKKIGTWIDGKPIYRKVLNFGNLPAGGGRYIDHNISKLGSVVDVRAIGNYGTNYYPIPFAPVGAMYSSVAMTIRINETQVGIATSSDQSKHTAIIILEYTKTTD